MRPRNVTRALAKQKPRWDREVTSGLDAPASGESGKCADTTIIVGSGLRGNMHGPRRRRSGLHIELRSGCLQHLHRSVQRLLAHRSRGRRRLPTPRLKVKSTIAASRASDSVASTGQ